MRGEEVDERGEIAAVGENGVRGIVALLLEVLEEGGDFGGEWSGTWCGGRVMVRGGAGVRF